MHDQQPSARDDQAGELPEDARTFFGRDVVDDEMHGDDIEGGGWECPVDQATAMEGDIVEAAQGAAGDLPPAGEKAMQVSAQPINWRPRGIILGLADKPKGR